LALLVIALAVAAVVATGVESASAATPAETSAVNWAIGQEEQAEYQGVPWVDRCLPFVEDAYADGVDPNIPIRTIANPTGGWNKNTDPQDVWSGTFSAGTTGGGSTTPPYGALVFFDAKPGYNPEDFSHVEIMGPKGEMIGTPGTPGQAVFEETLAQHEAARDYNTYVGWWLPDGATNSSAIGTQLAELKGSDTIRGDAFGSSVAISGSAIVVGASGHANSAGRAYVFTTAATGWQQTAELKGSDTIRGDDFGESVAISGSAIVVGAAGHANAGRAYVFTKAATGWQQTAELKGSDTIRGDAFGESVAISGSTIVVGALRHAKSAGRAYVFTKTATGWQQTGELTGSDTTADDMFGLPVAISGSTIVVGAYGHADEAGRAYVFTKAATGWQQTAELKGSDTIRDDFFGSSTAISGSTIVVGAFEHANSAGRAYVFTKAATGWQQTAELEGSDTVSNNNGDQFGGEVAISGSTIAVGASGHANSAGRAYVFTQAVTGWQQTAELEGSDTTAGDNFGWPVALSGSTLVVGAGDHADNSGRAYVFGV
jgi:hypothetical protein